MHYAQVWTDNPTSPDVQLVMSRLGPHARVFRHATTVDGVLVVVGPRYAKLVEGSAVGQGADHDVDLLAAHLSRRAGPVVRRRSVVEPATEPPVGGDRAQPRHRRVALPAGRDDEQVVTPAQDRTPFGDDRLAVADHERDRRAAAAAAARRPRRRAAARPG